MTETISTAPAEFPIGTDASKNDEDEVESPMVDLGGWKSTRRGRKPKSQVPVCPIAPPPMVPLPPPGCMMTDPTAGTYHPDFMFCGECSTCQPDDPNKVELEEEEKLETYEEEGESVNDSMVEIQTTFKLRRPLGNPSHRLVIQSLLRPFSGVTKVTVNGVDQSVCVHHDASLRTEAIINALDSVGHPASVQASQINQSEGDPVWVRSQFNVKGVCCATEIPTVRRIVKPLPGVATLQINLTTKVVHVQHDASIISAQRIADELTEEGFPAKVQKDGEASTVAKQQAMNHGRTILQVEEVLTDKDVSKIQEMLSTLKAVTKINVSIFDSVIFIDHDIYETSSAQCLERLKPNYTCQIKTSAEQTVADAAVTLLDQVGRSKFVESTITVDGISAPDIKPFKKAIAQNFINEQVRAVYPNIVSESIKVEHDPQLVSIFDICHALSNNGYDAKVSTNGADLNLYLPEQEAYSENGPTYGEEPSLASIHANVWLSGIFWFISIMSYEVGR